MDVITNPSEPKKFRPVCERCGWRKGGPDSWDGIACKCGNTEPEIERVEPAINEPFGRQPKPVTVTVKGEPEDVQFWLRDLMRRAGFKGDMIQAGAFIDSFEAQFTIYPRAVND